MSEFYESAKRAIRKVADDRSVSLEKILEDLEGLRDEIEMFIEATEADIEANKDLD